MLWQQQCNPVLCFCQQLFSTKKKSVPFMYLLEFWEMQIILSVEMRVCACASALSIALVPPLKAVWSSDVLDSWYIALHDALFRVWALVFGEWVGLVFLPRSAFSLRLDWCLKLLYWLMLLCWEELEKIVSVKLIFSGIRSIKSLWVRCVAQYMARG